MNENEQYVKDNWGEELIRQLKGCDFITASGDMVEIKAGENILSETQMEDMFKAHIKGKLVTIVFVRNPALFIFELKEVIAFHPQPKDTDTTMIRIKDETKEKLDRLKLVSMETYDNVIVRLLDKVSK